MKKMEMKKIAKMIAERNNETIINPSIYYGDEKTSMFFKTYDNEFGTTYDYFINFVTNEYHRTMLSSVCLHETHIYKF